MTQEPLSEAVRRVARSLSLVDDEGALIGLDSLTIVELVDALEHETALSIPPVGLTPKNFASLETLTAYLETLRP